MNGTADSVMKGSRETTLLLVLHIGKVKKIVHQSCTDRNFTTNLTGIPGLPSCNSAQP